MDDELDGCDLDFTLDPTPDENVDAVVIFADVRDDPAGIWIRRLEMMEWVGYV